MKEKTVQKVQGGIGQLKRKKGQSFMKELEKTLNECEVVLQDILEKQREAREYKKALSKAAKKQRGKHTSR